MANWYNENDRFAAAWLRELIKHRLIPEGEVDERSIVDVRADDLRGFRQCHFFAGIGGWPYALTLAGWPEDREVWTGSCPCQPLSVAGRRQGHADERHLWPAFHRLIAERRPATVFGEQVAGKDGFEWFAGVRADLEDGGYACGAAVMPACAVGAPHRRERLFWMAHADGGQPRRGLLGFLAQDRRGCGRSRVGERSENGMGHAICSGLERQPGHGHNSGDWPKPDGHAPAAGASNWSDAGWWLAGADGKARRVKPGVRLLVDGLPGRVGRLRGYGNAIVPQVAAAFIAAVMG